MKDIPLEAISHDRTCLPKDPRYRLRSGVADISLSICADENKEKQFLKQSDSFEQGKYAQDRCGCT